MVKYRSALRLFTVTLLAGAAFSYGPLALSQEQQEDNATESSPNTTSELSNKESAASITSPLNTSESKRWSLLADLGFAQDYETHTDDYLSLGAAFYYNLKNSVLFSTAEYEAPSTLRADSPERFGLSDVSVGWMRPNILRFGGVFTSDLLTSVTLPTSETSRLSQQYFNTLVALDTKYEILPRTLFIFRSGATFAQHEYETADAFGSAPNIPYGLLFRGTLRVTPMRGVLAEAYYQAYPYWDYLGIQDTIQSAKGTLKYSFQKTFSGYLSYTWKDAVLTNNELFDSAASTVSAGIEVGI